MKDLFIINLCVAVFVLIYTLRKRTQEFNNLYELCGKHLGIDKNVSEPIITKGYNITCFNCKTKNTFQVNNKGQVMGYSVKGNKK